MNEQEIKAMLDIQRMTTTGIASIPRGIVFLTATWSGGAQWAFPKLVAFLDQQGIPRDHLHVLDIDQHPELYGFSELTGKIHGWGEALIVKGGKIVLVTCLGKEQHLIHERFQELLRAYTA